MGIFEYIVMPFGLLTALAEWQLYLELVLWEFLGTPITVHLNGILLFTQNGRDHEWKEAAIEDVLRNSGLWLKERKRVRKACMIEYCGHLYGYGKAKLVLSDRTLLDWPKPRNQQELRKFMGHEIRNVALAGSPPIGL